MTDYSQLADQIKAWGSEAGFDALGITDCDLGAHAARLRRWLDEGRHGTMSYLARNVDKREHPERLLSGTVRILSARMDYLADAEQPLRVLEDPSRAYIARYALGRDYHKVVRRRLAKLAKRIDTAAVGFDTRYRAFTDSAPVLEKGLAEKAGLGWIGKNTLLLNRDAGSWFFLGEIFTNLPLPVDPVPEAGRLRILQRVHQRLPDQRNYRTRTTRRQALHFLSDHRITRCHPGRTATNDRQPSIRLRRLPALVPGQPHRATHASSRLRATPWARLRLAGRSVQLERGRVSTPHRRQRAASRFLHSVVPQPCGGPGQRQSNARSVGRVAAAPRRSFGAGARACGVGVAAADG